MNNKTDAWLYGVKARVAFQPRSANPYGLGVMVPPLEVKRASDWYGGWDTADIILTISNVKEPA